MDRLRDQAFDHVLLDLHMPQMDGLETLRAIRAFEKQHKRATCPVTLLTADSDPKVAEDARAAGATGFLLKPLDADAVAHHMNGSAQRVLREAG